MTLYFGIGLVNKDEIGRRNMCFSRRILWIPWTENVRDDGVLRQVETLVDKIK